MGQVVRELYSPSEQYKVEIINEKMVYIQQKFIGGWRIVDMSFGVLSIKGFL